ncbi:glutathione S-transferase family protein [Phanerochaete sordida]|uniref:Glutathione S-transferase family protein n=1 Tax=Phanerochaete sordida TaxID=48140 RepID=A0A9P3GF68_9APHY|nr:glutathione S-transferase family protein [Phanerochaete sordida]
MAQQITLYTSKVSTFAHRVEIALALCKVPYTRCEIDLWNKPEWYIPKVNPLGKVPVIAYGGPAVPPDEPSPLSTKLNESLVLVEFLADLYPASGLLPADPVLRAKARLFIDAVSTTFLGPASAGIRGVLHGGGDATPLVRALEALQALLPPTGFAIGEFSAADVALAPSLARVEMTLENNLGEYPAEAREGERILRLIRGPGLERWAQYTRDVLTHPAVASTFDKEYNLERANKRIAKLRAEK